MFMGWCQILDLKVYLQRNVDNYQSMPRVLEYLLYLGEIQYKTALCYKLTMSNPLFSCRIQELDIDIYVAFDQIRQSFMFKF